MIPEDAIWILELIRNRDARTEAEKDAVNAAIEALKAQLSREGKTSAQPEPQEGRWINGKCDLCGEHAPFWAMASTYHKSNYCPCCGAKMKGAKHETD